MIRLSHSEKYPILLPEGHRFPMRKYALLREQLVYEGAVRPEQLVDPEWIDDKTVALAHCPEFWLRAKEQRLTDKEVRRIGFPQTAMLAMRSLSSASGTVRSAECALEYGAGLNLAGGTHHAYRDRGEGFCLLNDVAIAARHLIAQGRIQRALVVDLDVHQGNGTAAIFAEDPSVFTFSMHCAGNYPFHKEQSDLDIALPEGTGDAAYMAALKEHLPGLMEDFKPDLVFYQAGVDVLETDKLGKLALSLQGLRERDSFVVSECLRRGLPLVTVMGGGYGELHTVVKAHCQTYKLVLEHYETEYFTLG